MARSTSLPLSSTMLSTHTKANPSQQPEQSLAVSRLATPQHSGSALTSSALEDSTATVVFGETTDRTPTEHIVNAACEHIMQLEFGEAAHLLDSALQGILDGTREGGKIVADIYFNLGVARAAQDSHVVRFCAIALR